MKLPILFLTLAAAALFPGACKHRNKQPACCAKNPAAYPTAQPTGSYSGGYGYVK
ncbi:MAG: hypothetical protein P1U81_03110 [Verrucomicrobiales bacterium]|nr:hypothetical protein [Verrucomicrobiales bacterium]